MRNVLIFLLLIFIFTACKKNKPEPENKGEPAPVTLLFPFQNSLCNVGTDSTDTESDVVFEWSVDENADEYELVLKNLNTGDSISETTSELKMKLRILRSTPYAWYIISKSSKSQKTGRSETWMFYNAGEAIENYAPFPAGIVSPKMAETLNGVSSVSLIWSGNDVDGDITGYDVYFGTTSDPPALQTNFQDTTINNIPVVANTIYYWEIITKDARGNSSNSGVYQFKIK